jgi:hypothetical protein
LNLSKTGASQENNNIYFTFSCKQIQAVCQRTLSEFFPDLVCTYSEEIREIFHFFQENKKKA